MTDQYQAFTQSPIGKFVVKNLGLPSPVVLERFESAQPVVKGAVLVGAAPSSVLSGAIAQVLSNIHTDSYVGNNVALQQEAAKVGLNYVHSMQAIKNQNLRLLYLMHLVFKTQNS